MQIQWQKARKENLDKFAILSWIYNHIFFINKRCKKVMKKSLIYFATVERIVKLRGLLSVKKFEIKGKERCKVGEF